MRKSIRLLLVFIFVFCFVPFVYAEEIPTEGVTYFLMYPNGEEDVTESYSIAKEVKEKLLYECNTDEYGQIVLDGWNNEGIIRVVQVLPDGYSTNEREMVVDLANSNKANFVNYRGLTNPTTARSLLVFIGVAVVIGATLIVSRRNKKVLMIIPIGVAAFGLYTAHAWTNSVIIGVVDGKGKALANVHVYIYGKPVVDAEPAIKFDANGGNFFDGKVEMYFRIPSEGCSYDQFLNSLSNDDRQYLIDNIEGAYREGYTGGYPLTPASLTNGMVLQVPWSEDNNVFYLKLDGNGGYFDFYGEALPSIYIKDGYYSDYAERFTNPNSYLIGFDKTASCSHFTQYGLSSKPQEQFLLDEDTSTVYMCWNQKPDGLYVNGSLFRGATNTCFAESDGWFSDNSASFYNNNYEFMIIDSNNQLLFHLRKNSDMAARVEGEVISGNIDNSLSITSIELVEKGRTVFYMDGTELSSDGGYYKSNNTGNIELVYDLLDDLYYNECYGGATQ